MQRRVILFINKNIVLYPPPLNTPLIRNTDREVQTACDIEHTAETGYVKTGNIEHSLF